MLSYAEQAKMTEYLVSVYDQIELELLQNLAASFANAKFGGATEWRAQMLERMGWYNRKNAAIIQPPFFTKQCCQVLPLPILFCLCQFPRRLLRGSQGSRCTLPPQFVPYKRRSRHTSWTFWAYIFHFLRIIM